MHNFVLVQPMKSQLNMLKFAVVTENAKMLKKFSNWLILSDKNSKVIKLFY